MVTLSANDVSVVVAENIAGSEDAFADDDDPQGPRARHELARPSTTRTACRTSRRTSRPRATLSILGRAIQDRFPKYFAYFQTRSFQYGSRTIRGHNRLLGKVEGVDGIKTGYTRLSGFNLLTSVNTDTRSIVAVVLGGRSGASRDQKMASLIDEQPAPRLCRRPHRPAGRSRLRRAHGGGSSRSASGRAGSGDGPREGRLRRAAGSGRPGRDAAAGA